MLRKRELGDYEQLLREERADVEQALSEERATLLAQARKRPEAKVASALNAVTAVEQALVELAQAGGLVRFLEQFPRLGKPVDPKPRAIVLRGQPFGPDEVLAAVHRSLEEPAQAQQADETEPRKLAAPLVSW